MSAGFLLWVGFGINALIYLYVGRTVVSQESYELPEIFWNPAARFIAVMIPLIGFAALIIAAFIWTDKGWWIVVATAAAILLLGARPKRYLQ